jgi:mono/diheme cytochrome c family protein
VKAVAPTTAMPCHAHHRRKLSNKDIEAVASYIQGLH